MGFANVFVQNILEWERQGHLDNVAGSARLARQPRSGRVLLGFQQSGQHQQVPHGSPPFPTDALTHANPTTVSMWQVAQFDNIITYGVFIDNGGASIPGRVGGERGSRTAAAP